MSPVTPLRRNYQCSGPWEVGDIASFPTKTGIDLLPGAYQILVAYTTDEGRQTQAWDCDFSAPALPGQSRCTKQP